jgi:MoaA/NifB/PqqE/SkfB family radical SAM enzyme
MCDNILSIDLWFELETECNLNCVFCYNFWKDNKQIKTKRLLENDIKVVLNNIFETVKCKNIALSGGEPLLRNDIFEIIDFLGKKNVNITLVTNSLSLNESKIDFLKNYNISFEIPLHSTNEKTHNYLTQNDSWEKTLENIINLKQTFNVTPVFVATKKNLNDFLDYLETMYILDIDKIIFNRFIPGGTGLLNLDSLSVTDKEIEKM